MPVRVEIKNRQRRLKLKPPGIRRLFAWVIGEEGLVDAEVSLLLTNNGGMQRLNRRYLGRDYPTDVLAFSQREGREKNLQPRYLGDVVISTQRVIEQASDYRQKVEDEFGLCLIHGALHLLGCRDRPARLRLKMKRREEELLDAWKRKGKWSLIRS